MKAAARAVVGAALTTHLPKPLFRILNHLSQHGETPAWVFDEPALDALFKMRPRLIRLAGGVHEEPILMITLEGETVAKEYRQTI